MDGYSISKGNAKLLADAWTNMERMGNRVEVEVDDFSKDRSLTLSLSQHRYAEDISRIFRLRVACQCEDLCKIEDIRDIYISTTNDCDELVIESPGMSLAIEVRDE